MIKVLVGLSLVLFFSQVIAQSSPGEIPDVVYINGNIITIDPEYNVVEAFAVKDGKFLTVGSSSDILSSAGQGTTRIDLNGKTVLPGLMDNHNHQYHVALLTMRGIDLLGVKTLEEILSRLEQAVNNSDPGSTIYTTMSWSESDLVEKRGPSLQELDQISPVNPVVVYETRSRLHLNSTALRSLGIGPDNEGPPRVVVHRDSKGEPTGLVTGQPAAVMIFAAGIVPQPSLQEKKELITRMQRRQNTLGLTGIRDLQLYPDVMQAYFELWEEGGLTLRVAIGLELNAGEEDRIDTMLSGFGDAWLRLDGVAEYNPGDWMREPYSNSDDGNIGQLRLPPQDFIAAIRKIHSYGWRPAIHVGGDRTLDLVLDAYEAADNDRTIKDRRWIVEHIQLVHDDQIERMKNLGVLVSAQFQPYMGAARSQRRWGRQRFENAMRIKDLLDNEIVVSGGSDWPSAPNNPFINMYYYITRDTLDLGPVGVEQKITRQDAIKVMSLNNAYMMFNEKITGSIETGKYADFVLIDEDILTMSASDIKGIRPVATFIAGKRVYQATGLDL